MYYAISRETEDWLSRARSLRREPRVLYIVRLLRFDGPAYYNRLKTDTF